MNPEMVICPLCDGRRATGVIHRTRCILCNARGEVPEFEAESGLRKLEVVRCPRCLGTGTLGSRRRLCDACMGMQMVPLSVRKNRDMDDFLTVKCPRCDGRGKTGLRKTCDYCLEDRQVSIARAREYVIGQIYSVECPCCFKPKFVLNRRCKCCGNLKRIHRAVAEYIEGEFTKLETDEEAIERIMRGVF